MTGLIAAALLAVACGGEKIDEPVTSERAMRLHDGATAFEVIPEIDRLTYFGPAEGPNMMFAQLLDQPPAADGSYTFFGGCYTWVAPQNPVEGLHRGWVDDAGEPVAWPPDPAMDVGPAFVTGRGRNAVATRTPMSRLGLVESKRFELLGDGEARLTFSLENRSESTVTAAPWINTAVHGEAIVAVPYEPGVTQVWGWDQSSIDRFMSILTPLEGTGWALVELPRADWEGGIKVYLDARPEIAVWRQGWWLHRGQTHQGGSRLRTLGEGPVAMYIQPAQGADPAIIEAELYGAVADLGPARSAAAVETWTLIAADSPSVSSLPE